MNNETERKLVKIGLSQFNYCDYYISRDCNLCDNPVENGRIVIGELESVS